MLAYLAGAIDQVDGHRQWRAIWAADLNQFGIGSYSPSHAWSTTPENMTPDLMGRVCRVNRAAISECQIFLANLDPKPYWGTLLELELARGLQRRIYVVSGEPIVSYEAWFLHPYKTWQLCLDQIVKDIQRPGGAG